MSETIRSEERGFHWVAWLASGQDDKPADYVLMVGKTREEAEARLKALAVMTLTPVSVPGATVPPPRTLKPPA